MQNRYRLLEVLGEGAFGVVFHALDVFRNHDVAVKFLKSPTLEHKRLLEYEAMLLEQLQHPFIVKRLDFDCNANDPYLVMEYCDHGSLRPWVGRLPWTSLVRILLQVGEGLQRIHEKGGVHCDIKPENLLLQSTGAGGFVTKVADLGITRVPGLGSTMTNLSKGTRGYIAPEVLAGNGFAAAADVFSLGIVAVELLTGHRRRTEVGATTIPIPLRNLVVAMTNPDPAQRPSTRLMLERLEEMRPWLPVPTKSFELEIN